MHKYDIKVLTSDRTLSKLKTPRLSQDEVSKLLNKSKQRYSTEMQELVHDLKVGNVVTRRVPEPTCFNQTLLLFDSICLMSILYIWFMPVLSKILTLSRRGKHFLRKK